MSSTLAVAKRRLAASVVALASFSILIAGTVALSAGANAAFISVPSNGSPGRLVLSSYPYPAQFLDLSPGKPGYWQIRAQLEDATEATLSLQLRKSGELVEHPRGLTMVVDSCSREWEVQASAAPTCPAQADPIAVATPRDDYALSSPVFELTALTAGAPRFLLVTLSVEDSLDASGDETLMGLTGDMGVGLTAVAIDGVPVTPAGPSRLPATGLDLWSLLAPAAIAAGLLGLGVALRISRKGVVR